ncbi:MAG: PLP-dependent aminotransferase family protein [Nannocystaceae bacterium]|nr:PLP-dependent aminotransferase family protein [Nannocystaceae bacterium]
MWTPQLARLEGPRYLAIADAIADDVAAGRLTTGQRMPTHRELADALGLTVGTITRAYAVAIERGLLSGEVGRGTFVRGTPPRARMTRLTPRDPDERVGVDLALNFLRVPEHDGVFARALAELSRRPDLPALFDEYKPQPGTREHRAAGARWLARAGLTVAAEDVLVCAGAQHALTVALLTLTRPGDAIAVEAVTYPGMLALARSLGRTVVGVAMDDEGMLPQSLDAVCRTRHPRLVYCMPTVQNPTARVMSTARREAIAQVLQRHETAVLEDDVYGFLAAQCQLPIASLVPRLGHFIAACTKSVAPGLRIGFLAVPRGEGGRFTEAAWATAVMAPPLTAELAARWIDDGTAARLADARRTEARARQQLARAQLGCPQLLGDPAAFHLWLPLPPSISAAAFVAAAQHRGVQVVPGEAFAAGHEAPAAVRVSLGPPHDHAELQRGLAVVADVLRDDARWRGV